MTKMTAIHIAAYKNWAKIIDILITWPNIKYTKSELNLYPHDLTTDENIKKKLLKLQEKGDNETTQKPCTVYCLGCHDCLDDPILVYPSCTTYKNLDPAKKTCSVSCCTNVSLTSSVYKFEPFSTDSCLIF